MNPAGPIGGGAPAARSPLFYGWLVVAVCFMTNFAAAGSQFYAFNAFMLPLCEARGWTRVDINLAPIIGFICGLSAQYLYGTVIYRVGPRRLMALGALVSAVSFLSLGRVESLPLFYLAYSFLIMGNAAMSALVTSTAVSNWFEGLRGRALGIATSGITLAGVVLPFLAHRLLAASGLASAFMTIALGIACLAPLAWLVVRDSPESRGLLPDGLPPAAGDPPTGDQPRAMAVCRFPFGRLVATGVFWRLGLAYGLASAGVFAVVFQLGPRFQDLGYDADTAMILVALAAACGTLGKFTWGTLCDRFPPNRLGALMFCLVGLGQVLGVIASGPITIGLFIAVFGFAMGGIMSTFPIMTAWCFGRAAFSSVFRYLALFLALQAVGYVCMGQSFSLTGSYDAAYLVFVFIDLGAAAMVIGARPVPMPD